MWIITLFSKENTVQFEFETKQEAQKALKQMEGYKILSEVVYCNEPT